MVVTIAIIVSRSVVFENYLIPIATVVAASLILLYLRRSVVEVAAECRRVRMRWRASGSASSEARVSRTIALKSSESLG